MVVEIGINAEEPHAAGPGQLLRAVEKGRGYPLTLRLVGHGQTVQDHIGVVRRPAALDSTVGRLAVERHGPVGNRFGIARRCGTAQHAAVAAEQVGGNVLRTRIAVLPLQAARSPHLGLCLADDRLNAGSIGRHGRTEKKLFVAKNSGHGVKLNSTTKIRICHEVSSGHDKISAQLPICDNS